MTEINKEFTKETKALGRGLRSLIPAPKHEVETSFTEKDGSMINLSVDQLYASKEQPREFFDEDALVELACSISEHGILQPLIVQKKEESRYKIIAGERRWRAAKIAEKTEVPCIILDIASEKALAIALVENIQREDLNAIEKAKSYQRLHDDLGHNQEEIAKAVGKERSTITNMMRLLRLPSEVQELVVNKKIAMGHARSLLSLQNKEDVKKIGHQIAEQGLSVRKCEALVQNLLRPKGIKHIQIDNEKIMIEREIRRQLEAKLCTKVDFKPKKNKGSITIHYKGPEQLNSLLAKLNIEL